MSLQIRETVERLIPDSLPRALTRSSTLRVETPSIQAEQITAHLGLVDPPAGVEQGREERAGAKLGDGQFHLAGGGGHRLGPRAVAAVGALRRALIAPRADHGGGLGVDQVLQPGLEQTPEDARLARSGSARTSRISVDTAHWFVAGIVGALLVNLGRRTWAPTMPAALPGRRAPSTPRARGNCHHTKRRTPCETPSHHAG